eukprot:jgi/Botrbrau1/12682/Bobra.67_1s0046.1
MNLSKGLVALALWYLGTMAHTPKHFLEQTERKLEKDSLAAHYGSYIPTVGILASLAVGYFLSWHPLSGPWSTPEIVSVVLAISALALRVWAVQTLDRHFTFFVGIRKDHKLIKTGPYRTLRHPSYTGTLLYISSACYFCGLRKPLVLAILMSPGPYATFKRIVNEEKVLLDAFGKECEEHFRRTWRLLPFIY